MKRIVVFGYGAIGREMVKLLISRGEDVIVVRRSALSSLP